MSTHDDHLPPPASDEELAWVETMLADEAAWIEPDPDLENRTYAAVRAAAQPAQTEAAPRAVTALEPTARLC